MLHRRTLTARASSLLRRIQYGMVLLGALLVATPAGAIGISEEEADVFAALLNHGLATETRLLVLSDQTTGDPAAIAAYEETAAAILADIGAPPELLTSWIRRNTIRATLDRTLQLERSYQLLSDEQRASLFDAAEPEAAWKAFYARYADSPGLLRVSRAGFDDRSDQALVYAEHQCGADCGSGRLVFLRHTPGQGWAVQDTALVWIVD
jgi:hypothetical protein